MKNNQPVIDFRVRPPFKGNWDFFRDDDGKLFLNEIFRKFNLRYEGSVKSESYEEFIKELDEENVVKAVIPGRSYKGISNEDVFHLAEREPDRFIPFPFIDPLEGEKALDYIDEYIINGKGKGVTLEPGLTYSESYDFDDERAFGVYKRLEENDIPVLITYSGASIPNFDVLSVQKLHIVARKFPRLKIILAHGGWPWVHKTIGLAYSNPNVYLVPDIYATYGPGAKEYAIAANTILKNQVIYGSSYPITTSKESIEIVKTKWGIDEANIQKVLYNNAASVLGL